MGRIGHIQALNAFLMNGYSESGEPILQRTQRGARLVQNGSVLSEVLSEAGPTHSVFDVLAAAIMLNRESRVGILGFAAGGVIAPLRAMNGRQDIYGVDLDEAGFKLFKRVSGDWRGNLKFVHSDAVKWLKAQQKPFDVLLEDLSIGRDGDVFKPAVSIDVLPYLVHSKLKQSGIAIFNLLPPDDRTWAKMIQAVSEPFTSGLIITFESFYNKVLILSVKPLTSTPKISRFLRKLLSGIQSSMFCDIQVRTLRITKS